MTAKQPTKPQDTSPCAVLDVIGEEQGWNTETKLQILLEYVQNQGDDEGFSDFLKEAAS